MSLDTATDETIKRLLADPSQFEAWLGGGDDDAATDERIQIDLDKAWHAIHFLLTGSAWGGKGLKAFLLTGGADIGEGGAGYVPARAFRAREVRNIALALRAVPPETLRARFNAKALVAADIYPSVWGDDPEDVDYVVEGYEALLQHLETAAAKGMGMVIQLT